MQPKDQELVATVHQRLLARYDVERWHWRPETSALDICLGAILVQHTSWTNVEKALANLRALPRLSPESLLALPEEELASLVRPAGTPLTKARRLQTFATLVIEHSGFAALFAQQPAELRRLLLATPGIGPETADVILLYAARAPATVHDAYTARIYRRLGSGPTGDRYDDWRLWLDEALRRDLAYRRQDHAALVIHARETCRVKPRCVECPLLDICAYGQANHGAHPSVASDERAP